MNVLVLGVSGGIGQAIVRKLCERDCVTQVIGTYCHHLPELTYPKLSKVALDVCDEKAVAEFAQTIDQLDWVINAVGFLSDQEQQPEKTIAKIETDAFMRVMTINTLPTLLLARYLKSAMKNSKHPVFATISAKVGSISDNHLGGWYSYRASKAALNMALKTLSVEWRRVLPKCTVAALHPGTTDTALSKPFQKNVPVEKLFSPEKTASYLIAIMDRLQPQDTGKFWSWDGSEIPW